MSFLHFRTEFGRWHGALRGRIGDRKADAMSKYFDGGYSGHLTLARDGFGFRAECAIHLGSKITLHADGMASDAYASADQAAIADREASNAAIIASSRIIASNGPMAPPSSRRPPRAMSSPRRSTMTTPQSTASRRSSSPDRLRALKQLSVSEAVTELDMTGAPVLVFRHAKHGGINIVPRRADGHSDRIEPPGGDGQSAGRCPLTQGFRPPYGPPPFRSMNRKRAAIFGNRHAPMLVGVQFKTQGGGNRIDKARAAPPCGHRFPGQFHAAHRSRCSERDPASRSRSAA